MMATSVISFKPLTRGRYRILINGVLGEITKNPKKFRISYNKAQINKERIWKRKSFFAELLKNTPPYGFSPRYKLEFLGRNDWL